MEWVEWYRELFGWVLEGFQSFEEFIGLVYEGMCG